MLNFAQLLHEYLRAVRKVGRRRGVRALLADLALLALGWWIAVVVVVGWSLRGDLGAQVGLALALTSASALVLVRVEALRGQLGSPLRIARAIARHEGPLRRRAKGAELERDAILRHELLGATELWQGLEREAGVAGERSPELATAYVRRIGAESLDLDPELALPRRAMGPRLVALALALAAAGGLSATELGARGIGLLLAARDARPPPPPRAIWTELELTLDYPAHTRRPQRRVPNPSGTLRLPAGTRVQLELESAEASSAARLVLTHDAVELGTAAPPEVIELEPLSKAADEGVDEDEGGPRWAGSFTVRSAGSWVIVLVDDDERDAAKLGAAPRRSAPMRIELEADALPEVELLPLPEERSEASETERIELRFSARDDFGVVGAELVYELAGADGSVERHRLPAGKAPGGVSRSWRQRYRWDLSAIPIEDRSEVSYWIEVRDNDPGLGLIPLPDGPGKVAASARQRLLVHDEEAEHAANIRSLQEIRDAAVDLLAARLTTGAFSELDRESGLTRKLHTARQIHEGAALLLTMIAQAVDALALDTMVAERDVETLAAIHQRLLELHHAESELHTAMPPGAEHEHGERRAPTLRKLGRHNQDEIRQLEDEIIRLDDLVDGQIIERIEALVARLQASQHKLVEKLEQLAAGDESVRPEIEQLEQRIREDMRRVQEARSQLRKEVGDEWMNLDAFKAMEARMRSQALLEQLRRGDVEGALQQARDGLEAIRQLRERVQRSGADAPTDALSEEDRKRMKLLRELSRLQDEQTGLRSQTQRLRESWREEVAPRRADGETRRATHERARKLRESLEQINDARLSREGREAWDDAREALEALEAASEGAPREPAGQLELFEAARDAASALERAKAGAKADEREGEQLRKLAREAAGLEQRLRRAIPDPEQTLDPDERQRVTELAERQARLRQRAERLLEDPAAEILPDEGRAAMQRADRGMHEARESLDGAELDGAVSGETRAWGEIQRAIDSLRDSSPPPPPQSNQGEASTEAERDRSLRDQVVEAMREGDRDDFDEDTKRYYEELLR